MISLSEVFVLRAISFAYFASERGNEILRVAVSSVFLLLPLLQ
jgi:hypothetical protein